MTSPQPPAPLSWPQPVSAPVQTYLWRAEQPRAAVLLAHGFGEYSARYQRLVGALNTAGFTVYTYDHRGHGGSAGRRAVADVQHLVQDHLAARQALRNLDLPLFAFGHSMGGLVTAASYLQDPRGAAGVVLSSPALLIGVNEPAWLKAAGRLLARVSPALALTELGTAGLSRLPEEVSAYEQDDRMHHGKVPVLTAVSMLRVSERLWPHVPRWTLPTLLLHGDADTITDVNGSRRFAREIGSTDTRYVEVPGGYHELFNDTVRDEVTAELLAWLGARSSGLHNTL